MSKMSELYMDIYDAIDNGELTFEQIAVKFDVSISDVVTVYNDRVKVVPMTPIVSYNPFDTVNS